MKAKIPITQRIIKAARYSDFKGGPLALAILLKLSDLQEVLVGEEILTWFEKKAKARSTPSWTAWMDGSSISTWVRRCLPAPFASEHSHAEAEYSRRRPL